MVKMFRNFILTIVELNRPQKYEVISKLANGKISKLFTFVKTKRMEKLLSFFVHFLLKIINHFIYRILNFYTYASVSKNSHKFDSV